MLRRFAYAATRPLLALALLAGCVPSFATPDANDASSDATTGDSGIDAPSDARATDTGASDAAPGDAGAISLDPGFPKLATMGNQTGATLSTALDVPAGGRLLVAVIVWGEYAGTNVWPVSIDGAGLTWSSRVMTVSTQEYKNAVGVAIWTAWADAGASGQTVTATRSPGDDGGADAILAVYSLAGASATPGASGTTNGFTGGPMPLSTTLSAKAAGSVVIAGLLDGNGTLGVRGATLPNTVYDQTLASGSGNGLAVGRLNGVTAGAGGLTLGQDSAFQYDVAAALEILKQ